MSESVHEAAAAAIARHRRLLRSARSGRIISALMLPLLRWSPPAGFGVLTTTGRRTGKRRSKCVRLIRNGDRAYLVALRPPHVALANPDAVHAWVLNIRANPAVRLQIRDGLFDGLAREITDPAEFEEAWAAICQTVHPTDYCECALHLRGLPSRTKIKELHSYWFKTGIPVTIDLKEKTP